MDVRPYVEQVKRQLAAAAALGDDATRATAEALIVAADAAIRLALVSAVAAVTDEVTVALLDLPGAPTVAVRPDGDEIRVEVRASAAADAVVEVPEDDATARVSLRLPEALKAQVDAAARGDGLSVNAWLIRAVQSALSRGGGGGQAGGRGRHAQRLSGWVNG